MKDVAIDTNILIYAHCSGFAEHVEARESVASLLKDSQARVNFTVGILHEFVHVISDSRRFQPPVPIEQAMEIVTRFHGRQNVRILDTSESDLINAIALMRTLKLGRGRVADTLLATTLRRHGVTRLLTRNLKDFRIFDFLVAEDPLS